MVLSIKKTKTLFISNSQPNAQQKANNHFENVNISNTTIDEVDSTKLLDVNVDKTLPWFMQAAQVKKCTSYRLFFLKKIRKYLPLETRIKFYDYYFKPLIEYCSSARGV